MNLTFHIDKFDVHTATEIENITEKDNKVCVVAVIGKSHYSPDHTKATLFNSFIKADAFQGNRDPSWISSNNTCRVEGYYDAQAGVIFLHLLSSYDTSVMVDMAKHFQEDASQDINSIWRLSEYSHTKALLFIFSVSHIILLSHPGTTFDISYIRLFKTLDAVRLKIQPGISELLKRLPISKDWVTSCRPCSPRVLFVFQSFEVDPLLTESDITSSSKSRNPKQCPIKELQHLMEDQIYRILRKARIITNTSNNSLFAVPQNQEFVYIHSKSLVIKDLINFYMLKLKSFCTPKIERESSRSKSYQMGRKESRTKSSESVTSSTRDVTQRSSSVSLSSEPTSVCSSTSASDGFINLLSSHINLALTKGFDDNVGRMPVQAVFELPSLSAWFAVVKKLHGVFWSESVDGKFQSHLTFMKSMLDLDIKLSEGHCRKVLPLAEAAYNEGLPEHYTLAYHNSKLQEAVNLYLQHARGPACAKYMEQLRENCTRVWQDGRQMCEEISLTGNHCVNELHRLPDMPEMESTKHLPVMAHSSQVKMKSACNCGRRQTEREDPFEHRMANYDFYQRLEQQCCAKLEHYEMSVFKPSTTEARAAKAIVQSNVEFFDEPESPTMIRKDSSKFDLTMGISSLSLALSLGQSGCSDLFIQNSESAAFISEDSTEEDDEVVLTKSDEEDEDEEEEEIAESESLTPLRQHSTTEYLPGMLHTDSLPGLLPKFPSWSLVLLGKYSSYNPAQGIDQPGFIHPSNFLLPMDVTIRTEKGGWQAGNDPSGKKGKLKKGAKDVVQIVRLYIGMEYECPRGHRFILSTPDRIFKAPPNGIFKETGHKVLNHDMPLYFPCSCRNPAQYMSQLMRIHVAVPEGGVDVKLKPKVQPGPPPCPFFFPEASDCLVLKSGLWVLRLPFVYLGESGPYRMPSDPQQLASCRFVKGFLSVSEGT